MRVFYLIILFLSFITTSSAYVIQTYRNSIGQHIFLHWPPAQAQSGILLQINTNSFPFPQSDVQRIFEHSMGVWNTVETAQVHLQGTSTNQLPISHDGQNVIYYDTEGTHLNIPANTGIIALTRLQWTDFGEITEADIVFNGRDLNFATQQNNISPTSLDLQDVLTHELGHLLGLDHTPLRGVPTVRPTMTPFYMLQTPSERRTLESDDCAGLSALYPIEPANQTGTITGHVTHANGQGLLGVHVVAYQANTSNFVASAFSGTDPHFPSLSSTGSYRIEGLPPGTYQIAIEPLNDWVTHQNFTGIFDKPFPNPITPEFFPNRTQQQNAPIFQIKKGQTLPHVDFVLGIAQPDTNMITQLHPFFNSPDITSPHTLSVNLQNRSGILRASLLYQINQAPYQIYPLQRNGIKYTAEIPHQTQGTQITYRILAQANNGTETIYPPWDQPALQFKIIKEFGDRLFVALNRSGEVAMLNAHTGNLSGRLTTGNAPTSIALAPNLKRIFVTHAQQTGGQVTSIDVLTQEPLATIEVGATPLDMVLSPDEKNLYVTNATGRSVSVIDPEIPRQRWKLPVRTAGEGPFGIAISPDGTKLYLTDPGGAQVIIIDADRGTEHNRIPTVSLPRSLALSPNGQHLYVAGFEGNITLIDTHTLQVLRTINTSPALGIYRIIINASGTHAFLTDPIDDNLLVLDLETERITHVLDCHRNPRDLTLSPDGNTLYVANQDANTILTFNTQTFTVQDTLILADGPRGLVAWNARTAQTNTTPTDLNGDGQTDFSDFLTFVRAYSSIASDPQYESRLDFDHDGQISFSDFLIFAQAFGT